MATPPLPELEASSGSAFVTTSARAGDGEISRAHAVATLLGWPYVPRTMNLAPLLARRADPLAYVISRAREALCAPGAELTTGPGMFHHVLDLGARHPLAIAVGNAASVVDGTLGLAKDALHIAQLTGAAVTGLERSEELV